MKTTIILCLVFSSFFGYSQTINKVDTIYYLVDIYRTTKADRMVEKIEEDRFTYYVIKCPCLKYDQQPTFIFRNDAESRDISAQEMKSIHFITLPNLIIKAKEYSDAAYKGKHVFYFIEDKDNQMICHKVFLMEPRKPRITNDYEIVKKP